jgi:hypothetical protein
MSEENVKDKGGSAAPQPESTQEEKNDFVPAKAYEEVTRDMHKYKTGVKEKEAQINELKAQLKAQEEAKMRENEQWQEIAQRREAEMEELRTQYSQKSSRFETAVKRTALKQELGGKIREDYLQFANLDAIQMDENGIVNTESLRQVANEFRKQHGQLIPKDQENDIVGHDSPIEQIGGPQPLADKASADDLVAHYAKLKQAK